MAQESAATQLAAGMAIEDEEEVFVASQWQLMWWRFRKHKAAVVALVVVLLIYTMALGAEFLASSHPRVNNTAVSYLAPQTIHWFDGFSFSPHVLGVTGGRDPETFQKIYQIDPEEKIPVKFFVRGFEYNFIGLIATDRHLFGTGYKPVAFGETPEPGAVTRPDVYVLGTDILGRDLWSRLTFATRISSSIGLIGVAFALTLGVSLGGVSGYYGGWIDVIIQRIIEVFRSIPTLPLWLGLAASVPRDWSILRVYFAITIVISFLSWTEMARVVRGRFLALREEDFVMAARLSGCSEARIIYRHMVPSFASHIIAAGTLSIPGMILGETALSFLGLGLRTPAISWGVLLQAAQNVQTIALTPWLMLPAMWVIIAVLAFNFLGDGLRDAADPYSV